MQSKETLKSALYSQNLILRNPDNAIKPEPLLRPPQTLNLKPETLKP